MSRNPRSWELEQLQKMCNPGFMDDIKTFERKPIFAAADFFAHMNEKEYEMRMREDAATSMMEKLEEMRKDTLLEALVPELAKKDAKAAKRPCLNGLDKYTTGQLKDELRRRKGN